uniref:Secreted protein n=1 Tax=Panagrellus redivivus TaxID=6233 RepID=A0A7E4V1Y7_PANRE
MWQCLTTNDSIISKNKPAIAVVLATMITILSAVDCLPIHFAREASSLTPVLPFKIKQSSIRMQSRPSWLVLVLVGSCNGVPVTTFLHPLPRGNIDPITRPVSCQSSPSVDFQLSRRLFPESYGVNMCTMHSYWPFKFLKKPGPDLSRSNYPGYGKSPNFEVFNLYF